MSDKLREELQNQLIREIENWTCKPLQDAYTVTGIAADYILAARAELLQVKQERDRLREAISDYCEARRRWMGLGDDEVQQEVAAWKKMEDTALAAVKPETIDEEAEKRINSQDESQNII